MVDMSLLMPGSSPQYGQLFRTKNYFSLAPPHTWRGSKSSWERHYLPRSRGQKLSRQIRERPTLGAFSARLKLSGTSSELSLNTLEVTFFSPQHVHPL